MGEIALRPRGSVRRGLSVRGMKPLILDVFSRKGWPSPLCLSYLLLQSYLQIVERSNRRTSKACLENIMMHYSTLASPALFLKLATAAYTLQNGYDISSFFGDFSFWTVGTPRDEPLIGRDV